MNGDEYLREIETRLLSRRFTRSGNAFHRRAFSLTKFGFIDTLCSLTRRDDCPSSESLKEFSRDSFRAALKAKVWLPRGLGGGAVSYAVMVVDQASADATQFIGKYQPKHWASFEFPVLIDLSQGRAIFCESTPIFGSAYYAGFRKEAGELFALSSGN